MGEKEKAIAKLKLTREIIKGFSNLIKTLSSASRAHGIPIKEIQTDNSFMGQTLVDALPPERLGLLIKAVMGIAGLQRGLTDFMSYDQYELDDLNKKLETTIEEFDQVLEGL